MKLFIGAAISSTQQDPFTVTCFYGLSIRNGLVKKIYFAYMSFTSYYILLS